MLQQIIINSIASSPRNCLTFADYFNLVLYHPQYGYYSSNATQIGKEGDFFTSASLSADFGELLAIQFYQMWEILGYIQPFSLLEMGAGTGHLAEDILNYLEREYPDFYSAVEYIVIETSPQLINRQKQVLAKRLTKIKWQTWSDLPNESLVGCCFSNELVDALPIHILTLQQQQLLEVYVTYQDNQLQEIYQPLSCWEEIAEYFQLIDIDFPSSLYPENYRTEVNLAALDWLKTVASKLKQGYLLTIDYGYDAWRYYHPQRSQGTLQCYYHHQTHHNPYINLGQQDITTHVNFTALESYGELIIGLNNLGFTKQGMFLMALGLNKRLLDLSSNQYSIQEVLAKRDFLHQLINPQGLGNFGVLLQGKGLTTMQQQSSLIGFTII